MAGYGTVPLAEVPAAAPWAPPAAEAPSAASEASGAHGAPPGPGQMTLRPAAAGAAASSKRDPEVGAQPHTPHPSLPPGPLSVSAATTVVVKALLGLTLFSQPWAAANAGVLVLPSCLSVTAFVCLYTAQMLVTVRRAALAAPRGASSAPEALNSLPALVEAALGPFAGIVVELAVLLACFGILAAYLVRCACALRCMASSLLTCACVPAHLPSLSQSFASTAVWPLFPSALPETLLVWLITPGAAALCLTRGMEHAALLSAAGNLAAAVSAGSLVALFAALAARRGWRAAPAELISGPSDWSVDAGSGDGVPVPAAALAAATCGYFIHFILPAVEASMTSPRRAMEAVGRGTAIATASLAAFGALGVAALGAAAPRVALTAAGKGPLGCLMRLAAAVDVLATLPVLCRPGLLVLEVAWERATEAPLGNSGASVLRCAFVAAAAAAATAQGDSLFAMVPFVGAAAAIACSLVAPPLLLLLGCDANGDALVTTSGLERALAALIGALGCAGCLLAAMALAGDMTAVPFPYTAPPSPPAVGEYDYAGAGPDYAPLRYAFSRAPVLVPSPQPVQASINWSNPAAWNHSWQPQTTDAGAGQQGGQQQGSFSMQNGAPPTPPAPGPLSAQAAGALAWQQAQAGAQGGQQAAAEPQTPAGAAPGPLSAQAAGALAWRQAQAAAQGQAAPQQAQTTVAGQAVAAPVHVHTAAGR